MSPTASRGDAHELADASSRAHPLSRRFVLGLAAIALIALAVRVYFVLVGYGNYKLGGDAFYYHYQGWAIADGRWFIGPVRATAHGIGYIGTARAEPSATHPPLYGMYLGLVSRLGVWSVTGQRLASCLLGTAGVVVVGLTGRRIGGERVGLVAALLGALYANFWINDGMLLSESMSLLTVALVLLAAYSLWRRPTTANAVWFGVALGAAMLSRAEVALLAPLLALPLVLGMRSLSLRRRLGLLGVAAALVVLVVGPWVGFNLSRFEKPVTLTDGSGAVLSSASCDATYSGKYAGWYSFCYRFSHGPVNGDESQRDAVVQHDALQYIRHHLGRLPVVMAMRVGRLWDVYRPGQTLHYNAVIEGRTRVASRLGLMSFWLMAPFAIAGTVVMRRRRIPISPIVAPVIVVTVAAAIFFGVLRYRITAEPAVVLAAAVSIDVLWTSLIDRRSRGDGTDAPAANPPPSPAAAHA